MGAKLGKFIVELSRRAKIISAASNLNHVRRHGERRRLLDYLKVLTIKRSCKCMQGA